jgi:hypothetical protein
MAGVFEVVGRCRWLVSMELVISVSGVGDQCQWSRWSVSMEQVIIVNGAGDHCQWSRWSAKSDTNCMKLLLTLYETPACLVWNSFLFCMKLLFALYETPACFVWNSCLLSQSWANVCCGVLSCGGCVVRLRCKITSCLVGCVVRPWCKIMSCLVAVHDIWDCCSPRHLACVLC